MEDANPGSDFTADTVCDCMAVLEFYILNSVHKELNFIGGSL